MDGGRDEREHPAALGVCMIVVYPPLGTDLTTGGRYLTPISAVVSEEANGPYELTLTHLRDEAGRFASITCGSVIRCPAPPKSTPLSKIVLTTSTVDIYTAAGTASIENTWKPKGPDSYVFPTDYVMVPVTKYSSVPIYSAIGGSVVAYVSHGARLTYVETSGAYYRVITRDNLTGYVRASQAAFYAAEETTSSAVVDAGAVNSEQLFRVYKIAVTSPDRVTAYARHISYDASATKFNSLEATATPIATLLATLSVNGISCHTTLTDTITETWTNQTAIEILLDLCETLDAQLVRDNHDLYLLPAGTSEATAQLAVGKNITAMSCETNWDSLLTRYIPVISGTEGTAIDSAYISDYPLVYIDYLTADSQGEAATAAAAEFAKGVDLPEVTVDIQFAENEAVEVEKPVIEYLADSGGNLLYTLMNELIIVGSGTETIELPRIGDLALFDLIHAVDGDMGVDVSAQIVSLEYDALRRRTGKLSIGKARSRLTGSIYTKPAGTWQSA